MDNQAASPGRSGISSEVYALLAQANLLRMRGCWGEAVENCMAALRLTPDSHSAQSLLGDIYENQGRYDDAIQWYRMALDLNPSSPADRMKLERLSALQREGLHLRLLEEQTVAAGEAGTGALGPKPSPQRVRVKPEVVLRAAALTAALLVFVVLVSAYVSVHRRSALSVLGLGSSQDVKTPLVVLSSTDAPSPALMTNAVPRDSSEQTLLDALRSSPDLASAGIVTYDAQADPRTARLTLTFAVTSGSSGGLNREAILRAALRLVQAASTAPGTQAIGVFTVRCLMVSTGTGNSTGTGAASLVFIGDVPRDALPSVDAPGTGLSASQVQAFFGSPWWSPQLPA